MSTNRQTDWPELALGAWHQTCATLHLFTQIVGKIRLARTPWLNHSWHVTLYVTARGLTTSPIPAGERSFELLFDFIAHELRIDASDGEQRTVSLHPQTTAEFFARVLQALAELRISVRIDPKPCEIPNAIALDQDREHSAYDPVFARRFWQVLVRVDQLFKRFRTRFIGKASPVHFFWGSFDLAVTRFSGRCAPRFEGRAPGVAQSVMCEAYSHEVSSAGFWPGGNGIDYAAFYSYMYPSSPKFSQARVQPDAAFFDQRLGEFLLPYDVVRQAADPEATLLSFLQSTYEAAAAAGSWDREELECREGIPGVPREIAAER